MILRPVVAAGADQVARGFAAVNDKLFAQVRVGSNGAGPWP